MIQWVYIGISVYPMNGTSCRVVFFPIISEFIAKAESSFCDFCNFLIAGDPFFVQRRSFTSSHIRSGLEPMIFDLQDAVIQPLASVLFPMEGRVGPRWPRSLQSSNRRVLWNDWND